MSPIALIPDWSVVLTKFTSLSVSFSFSPFFCQMCPLIIPSLRCLFVFFPDFSLSLSLFFLSSLLFSLLSCLSLSLYRIPHIVVTLLNESSCPEKILSLALIYLIFYRHLNLFSFASLQTSLFFLFLSYKNKTF